MPSRSTKKRKDTAPDETGCFNESPGGKGSHENSTAEYIKKLQAELAELKAAQGIASSSHTVRHSQRGQKGSNRQVPPRYEISVLSQKVHGFIIAVSTIFILYEVLCYLK